MTRIFTTYPRRVVRVNDKRGMGRRRYTATAASWARVQRLIQSERTRSYFRTHTGFCWEYNEVTA